MGPNSDDSSALAEAGDALDPGAGDVEPRRDAGQDRGRQPAGDVLGVDEDLQQAGRIVPVSLQDAVEGGRFVSRECAHENLRRWEANA